MAENDKIRLVFEVPEEYRVLMKKIAAMMGRSMNQELRLAINRRALEIGLDPVMDETTNFLMKEYRVYTTSDKGRS